MFCQECGAKIEDTATACPACGRAVGKPANEMAAQVRNQIKESSQDAARAFRALIVNPVGGLHAAYGSLGESRAIGAGAVLAVLFALLGGLAATIATGRMTSGFLGFLMSSTYGTSRVALFFKSFLGLLVLPAAMAAVCHGLRRVIASDKSFAPDLFTAGASLLPLSLAGIVAALLGAGNAEVALVLVLFALCYQVLILFTGLRELGGVGEKAAAPATPIVLLLSAWLTKIVLVALL